MDTNQAKMEQAIRDLALALPKGKHMQAVAIRSQVGFADTGAGTVYALLIADSAEDLARTGQIINKGISASQDTLGLADSLLRTTG